MLKARFIEKGGQGRQGQTPQEGTQKDTAEKDTHLENACIKGISPNPCDRSKMGVKQSLLVEERDGPLSICIAGANVNDHLLLAAMLDAIVVEGPVPTQEQLQHLCLDKGYDNEPTRHVLAIRGYVEHIRRIGEEKKDEAGQKRYPARRWVVERTFSWLCRFPGCVVGVVC